MTHLVTRAQDRAGAARRSRLTPDERQRVHRAGAQARRARPDPHLADPDAKGIEELRRAPAMPCRPPKWCLSGLPMPPTCRRRMRSSKSNAQIRAATQQSAAAAGPLPPSARRRRAGRCEAGGADAGRARTRRADAEAGRSAARRRAPLPDADNLCRLVALAGAKARPGRSSTPSKPICSPSPSPRPDRGRSDRDALIPGDHRDAVGAAEDLDRAQLDGHGQQPRRRAEPTLREHREAREPSAMTWRIDDPLVQAVFETFPGARLVNVHACATTRPAKRRPLADRRSDENEED